MNPGPGPTSSARSKQVDFDIITQNCRGLTDQKKAIQVLRLHQRTRRSATISCLQETHYIDRFAIDNAFNGKAVIYYGDRNGKGVVILVPYRFDIQKSAISGEGRWAIVTIRNRSCQEAQVVIVATLYAPNCLREALPFYQQFLKIWMTSVRLYSKSDSI